MHFHLLCFVFVAFSVLFIDGSFSYKEEDYYQEGWQEAEDGQYQVQVSSALWEIHSILHKGNHHSGKICRLSGFERHFHSKSCCCVSGDTCSYDSRDSQILELGVSEFCSTVPNSHVKSRVCFRVLSRNGQRGRL